MLGDILEELVSSIDVGPSSKRSQALFRIAFGLLGTLLSIAGVIKVISGGIEGASTHFNVAAALNLASLGFFCFFNVTLHKPWRWPGRLFALSFIGLFVVRILLGP